MRALREARALLERVGGERVGGVLKAIDAALAPPVHEARVTPPASREPPPEAALERQHVLSDRNRTMLDHVLAQSPHGVIICDAQGQLVLQNAAADRIWAGKAEAADVEGWGQYRAYHPDGRPFEGADWSMSRCLLQGETIEAEEVHFQRFDGSHGILLGSCAPLVDERGELTGAVSVFADITSFKMDAALKAAVLAAAPDCFVVIDENEVVIDLNAAVEATLGWSRDAVIGRSIQAELRRAGADGALLRHVEQGWRGSGARWVESTLRDAEGRTLTVELSCAAVSLPWRSLCVLCLHDVTDRKRAELELASINDELEAFTSAVSHDLRAPLRRISGLTEMLVRRHAAEIGPKGQEMGALVVGEAHEMTTMIEELLRLAGVTTRELERRDLDLGEMATEIVGAIRAEHPELEVEVEPDLVASGDPTLVRTLLTNLLRNAQKYSARAPAPRVHFGKVVVDGEPRYFVRDNGVGFDPALATRLFKPFSRLHSPDEFLGTGVGLAIVQRVARRHGGRAWAESASDEGACFWFTLGEGSGSRRPSRSAR